MVADTPLEPQEPTIMDPAGEADPAAAPVVVARRRPLAQRIAKWTAIVIGGLALLIGAVIFGLNTAPGKRFVADQIAGLQFENGMQISVGRIEGSLYGDMVLRNVAVSDPQGVFLTAPELLVDWRPFRFLRSHIDIRSLSAQVVTLVRVPEFDATPPSDSPLLPNYDIDIGAFRIERFIAEAAVSGERRVAAMDGKAHIADGRAQVTFDGATLAAGGIAGGDRIGLRLDAVPEANRLDLALDLNAPADGVIAALAGLDDALQVTLQGRGDWENWAGQLNADLAESEFARLALTARNGTFGVRGDARAGRLFEGPTAQLLSPAVIIDLTAALENRQAMLNGNLRGDAFTLDVDGLVDLAQNRFGDLALSFGLLRPAVMAENLSGRGVRADLVLNGDFATPRVAYQINAARLAFNDTGLENLRARGDAVVDAERILIPIEASVSRITGLDTVAGGQLLNVRLAGDLAIDGTRILSDNIRIRSDRIDAGLILVADVSTGLYTGAIDGRIDNYRIESVGTFDIETDVNLESDSRGFVLAGRVRARSTRLENESIRDFLGGNAVAATDIAYGTDGTLRFTNLSLRAPAVQITGGSGFYSPDGRIALNADDRTDAYGLVGVRVAGTISDPRAVVTAERPGLGVGLANLRAAITGAPGGYRIDAAADTDYGPFTADVILGTADTLTLQITRANFAGVDLSGGLQQTQAGPFAGRLDANGRGLSGVVRLNAAGQYQEALINLRASNSVFAGPANLAIGSGIIDARVVLYESPEVVTDVQLAQTTYGDFNLAAARAKIDYRDGAGTARVLAEGVSGVPFRVAANAEITPDLARVQLKGRARGIDFATSGPARIAIRGSEYELLPTRINFGQGSLRLSGRYGDGIELRSRLDALDMALVNAFVPGLGINGRATGSLDFAQASSAAFPTAEARMTIAGFSRTTAASVSQPVDIEFAGNLAANQGEARAIMRRRGSVIGRLVANVSPLGAGAGDWMARIMGGSLNGGIRYNGPADTLFSFAGQPDQSLGGSIGVAADFSGAVQNPQLAGVIRANDLIYENNTYGTRLSNMAISGRFTGDRVEFERLSATAGNGTVRANGFISLAEASGYPMNVEVQMQNARLARSDALAATATGNLRLTKAAGQDALLAGRITLPETRYQIIRQGAAEVPELTGVRFKPPRGPQRITGSEPAQPEPGLFGQLRLDVALVAPSQLYVSGMGLESEWNADLRLTGTSAAPRVAGEVELLRGTLGFAGRSFDLTEGEVDFTGGATIDPTIRLTATSNIEGVTVNVNVSGRALDPQIAFSSVPGLPQDEIVSRILFGSSVGNLSAIQTVQLAASLNSLRGSGGGLNPLGKLRSATGVDRLRILGSDEATGRGTALAAGQYLTNNIYIEFITDARGFTATQLEIALTPTLSVLSQAGGSGATNANVRYRRDY